MHGNVWEWVEDCYLENYVGAPENGVAWSELSSCGARVLRGGSWYDPAARARSATRYFRQSRPPFLGIGFRVLCVSPIE